MPGGTGEGLTHHETGLGPGVLAGVTGDAGDDFAIALEGLLGKTEAILIEVNVIAGGGEGACLGVGVDRGAARERDEADVVAGEVQTANWWGDGADDNVVKEGRSAPEGVGTGLNEAKMKRGRQIVEGGAADEFPVLAVDGMKRGENGAGAGDFDPVVRKGVESAACGVTGVTILGGTPDHAEAVAGFGWCDEGREVTGACGEVFTDHDAGFGPRIGGVETEDAGNDLAVTDEGLAGEVETVAFEKDVSGSSRQVMRFGAGNELSSIVGADQRRRGQDGRESPDGVAHLVEGPQVGAQLTELILVEIGGAVSANSVGEGGGGAVVKVRAGFPKTEQSGNVEARERAAETGAGGGFGGADVGKDAEAAASELLAGVAGDAVVLKVELAACLQISGAGGAQVRAFARVVEALQIGSEGVEVGTAAGVGFGESGVWGCIRDEAGAARETADLVLEVLNLIEVAGPMQRALGGATMTAEGDGVAQALSKTSEVPSAAVLVAIVVTGGAGDVTLEREAGIEGIVEVLFADQDGGGEFLHCDGAGRGQEHGGEGTAVDERGDVKNADAAVHEVVDVEGEAIGGKGEALWGASDLEAGDFFVGVRINDSDGASALEGDVKVAAPFVESGGTGHAGVVEVDAGGQFLGLGGEVHSAGDGAHGLVVGELLAVAQEAAFDVVLLRGDPGGETIGRDDRRAEVVGDAACGGGGVGGFAVGQQNGALKVQRSGIEDEDFAPAPGGIGSGGAFSGHGWGDEAADVEAGAISADG